MLRRLSRLVVATLTIAALLPSSALAADPPTFSFAGRYDTDLVADGDIGDVNAAETVAFAKGRMYVSNATDASVDIVDISDPAAPELLLRVDMTPYGASVSSVEAKGTMVAVAVVADPKTSAGKVVFMNRNGVIKDVATVGALPDALAFTPNGRFVVVAGEGEPNDDYTVDPFGTVSIIQAGPFMRGQGNQSHVRTLNFAEFNTGGPREDELPEGVRIYGPGASVAQDLEPESVAISHDSRWAWVSLQENNAIAKINLRTKRINSILPLGFKDFNNDGNELDASDKDGTINITNWPAFGMYQPDAIAPFKIGGTTYLVSANEGDARDYDGFSEETRVKDLTLDTTAFPDWETLNDEENLGRLRVTSELGDEGDDDDYEALYAYGARSFSIWSGNGQLLWDSGSMLEDIVAADYPDDFNSNNDENDSFDSRSDDKGPEPEAVATGKIDGRWYAFIGLERIGGVMVFDVTDPLDPEFVDYLVTRDFGADPVGPDSGPEDIKFVSAGASPTGHAQVLAANEITGTVTIWEVNADPE